jgi:glycosyltransferase involved in cell wall biosynthesis
MDKKTLIIVPAFNEERNLPAILSRVHAQKYSVSVLVVNDGSTDRTSQAAKAGGAIVVDLPFNMGYGAALQTGYQYALQHGFEFVVQIDADGQHEAEDIKNLLIPLIGGEADLIIGTRYYPGSAYKTSAVRWFGGVLFNIVTQVFIKQPVTDSTSGFQAMNRRVLALYSSNYFPSDYPDADVLVMSHFAGIKIKEVPVRMYARQSGSSMHSFFSAGYYVFKMILSIVLMIVRKTALTKGENVCR